MLACTCGSLWYQSPYQPVRVMPRPATAPPPWQSCSSKALERSENGSVHHGAGASAAAASARAAAPSVNAIARHIGHLLVLSRLFVMPAKAGIPFAVAAQNGIPACAGMTLVQTVRS